MLIFASCCLLLGSSTVRGSLEALFAELVVVFVDYLAIIGLLGAAALVLALVITASPQSSSRCDQFKMPEASRSYSMLSALVLVSTLMPSLALAATAKTAALSSESLATLKANLTTCTFSKKDECVGDPMTAAALGKFKRAPGHCALMDSSYIPVASSLIAVPNAYNPISVDDAVKAGFTNQMSGWSKTNQDRFQADCPLLHNELTAQGQDKLCCTESQFELLHTQIAMIPGQCSACQENLRHLWCSFACSPNNSMFIDVKQVRLVPGDSKHKDDVFPAAEEVDFYVGDDVIRDVYDYCEADQVVISIMCNKASNCDDGHGVVKFMGDYRAGSLGSPLQINFKSPDVMPQADQASKLCGCNATNSTPSDCLAPMDTHLQTCAGVCNSVCKVDVSTQRTYTGACYDPNAKTTTKTDGPSQNASNASAEQIKWQRLMNHMAVGLERTSFHVLNWFLVIFGIVAALALVLGFAYSMRRHAKSNATIAAGQGATESSHLSGIDNAMVDAMQWWGHWLSHGNHPVIAIVLALATIAACTSGLSRVKTETDPIKLWVAESSGAYKDRDRYGKLFMPFYRAEQIILVPKDGGIIGRREYLEEAIRVQALVANVTYGQADAAFPQRVTLEDVCWKATSTACTVNSITQYFQNKMEHFEFYDRYGLAMDHFKNCFSSPTVSDMQVCGKLQSLLKPGEVIPESMNDCPCLSSFGAPMNLYNTYLGGFPAGAEGNTTLYLQSKAFVSTALVYNYHDSEDNKPAVHWEREFIDMIKEEAATNKFFDIYFMAETSVQDEIARESSGDVLPVALSYTLMIIYVTLGINRWSFDRSFFVTAKLVVGFLGVVCIMAAVTTTIGLFAWCGVKVQLVIVEVVPFLTLAIGVDNIFLLVHAMDQQQHQLGEEQRECKDHKAVEALTSKIVSGGLGTIGPSIFMASFAESVAFAFGCISPMPAVLWFAAFSAAAVMINLALQMTLLLALLILDKRRELSGRWDVLCCSKRRVFQSVDSRESSGTVITPGAVSTIPAAEPEKLHFADRCVQAYGRFLSRKLVKLAVLLLFLVLTLLSISSIENIQHGLPQAESMSSTSYLIDYFNALDRYLATGPPVYFVVEAGHGRNPKTFNFTDQQVRAKFCKTKEFCDDVSVPKIVDALGNVGDNRVTHLSKGVTYSWMDDLWGFASPQSDCCRVDSHGAYLPVMSGNISYSNARSKSDSCLPAKSQVPPLAAESFNSIFGMFATASAGPMCSYGGGSIYRGQFSIDNEPIPPIKPDTPRVVLNSNGYGDQISAFSYMILSTSNPTQQDYIDLYKQSRRAAEWISSETGFDVWPYSIVFAYFDQYLTVVSDTYKLVGGAIAAIFVIHAIYFCGIVYPLVVSLAVLNIVLHVMGLMRPLDIMLNGLSVVNLIIAAGVSVEFCAHFVRMFAKARGSGDERAQVALRKVLVSVLFGITITKLVGLSALTLADSRIFQKYYFRMYMAIVLCGIVNGMVLLPVLLSVAVDVRRYLTKACPDRASNLCVTPPQAYQSADTAKIDCSSTDASTRA
ncbi:TPA: hypothetical protein N0F65_002177 [Lagenidium giganteum]|uniref:SSD domain-containing protein n=1 Tax=Lagenidium giganteum TaxID=4803 RepID=A0AAV2YJY1_9STRA|nr:TPA: hypothetical protein N0F65_002177 [Lagenidium giganteum]